MLPKLKEAGITELDSLLFGNLTRHRSKFLETRNLLRIAVFNISYIRGLFPEKYFNDKSVPALEMKIKKLMPVDPESRRLIDWMEKGVYDALQKKYLKTLLFCICEAVDGPMIEEYAFSFSYSDSDGQEVSMNVNRTGDKKGGTFKCNSTAEITPNQMRSSACKMVRTLVQLMRTLDRMPEERTILMKLLYYDDVMPTDYEPPFFRSCKEDDVHNSWTKNPLKMEVGNVNCKHLILALRVKSVLDPCVDENEEMDDDDGMSLGADSPHNNEYFESDSEVNQSDEDQYIVAPAGKERPQEENGMADEDDTQDLEEDQHQLGRVKDWIDSCHLDNVELTDVLSHFPDISVVLAEEIMDKLLKEGVLFKTGADMYTENKQKIFDYEFNAVKEEMDGQAVPSGKRAAQVDDHIYTKALYHALPMKYVTAAKLQSKLDGEVNQTTARKLIDRMTRDGYLEAKGNCRLGKCVIQSILTEKKLMEVKRALGNDSMDIGTIELHNKSNHSELQTTGNEPRDNSTCGILHSVGSDLTRMKLRSEMNENESTRSEQTVSKAKDHVNTPMSRLEQPAVSRESFVPGNGNGRPNGNTNPCDMADTMLCTQEKKSRKTSTVKEPIIQSTKRQKSLAT